MATTARVTLGGMVFHVLNRAVAHMQLFGKPTEYETFEHVFRWKLTRIFPGAHREDVATRMSSRGSGAPGTPHVIHDNNWLWHPRAK